MYCLQSILLVVSKAMDDTKTSPVMQGPGPGSSWMYVISCSLREQGEVVDPEPILPMKKSGAGEERAHGHRAGKRWLGVESLHPISQELLMERFPLCACHFSSRVPSSL